MSDMKPPEESFIARHDMSLVTLQQIRELSKTWSHNCMPTARADVSNQKCAISVLQMDHYVPCCCLLYLMAYHSRLDPNGIPFLT